MFAKIKELAGRAAGIYKYYSDKRFTTVAGTLVYFFLMSLAPFLFWLSLFFGDVDLKSLSSFALFNAIMPILKELQSSAVSATSGAGIVLMITTLYSSTNFFYHLRRSGEIIYDGKFKKGGIIAGAVGAVVAGEQILRMVMNAYMSQFVIYSVALVITVLVAALMNIFICPYKISFKDVIPGSLFTVLLWLLCAGGFAVYMYFANPVKLYGKIASVIVFLLWCYLMMNSFVIGVIYNGRHNVKLKHALNPS